MCVSRLNLVRSAKGAYSGCRSRKYLRSGKLLQIKELTGEDVVWARCYPVNDTIICMTKEGKHLVFDRVCGLMIEGVDWKWIQDNYFYYRKNNPIAGRRPWALPGG
jgi:hypothetical protein